MSGCGEASIFALAGSQLSSDPAQAKLDTATVGVGRLNSPASQVTTQASVAGYLLENARATFAGGGAVDEDHCNLRAIESETTRSMEKIDRLIGDFSAQISRKNGYPARERTNLAALSYGVNLGRLGNPGARQVKVTQQRRPVPLP